MKYIKFLVALDKHLNNFFINAILTLGFLCFPIFLRNINLFGLDDMVGVDPAFGWSILLYIIYLLVTFFGLMILTAVVAICQQIIDWGKETLTPAIHKAKKEVDMVEDKSKVTFE